jgi:predicted methyltransferase
MDNQQMGPLLTQDIVARLRAAGRDGGATIQCSLDLGRTTTDVEVHVDHFIVGGTRYPYPERCRDRTVYHFIDGAFEPVARYAGSLIKLVPTDWGPPTFEIDGIKMLPTSRLSPYEDASRKVALVAPRGKTVLDTCGGLGYFAACCLAEGAARILSYEKNADVIWLRSLNPWSPAPGGALELTHGDVTAHAGALPAASVDVILHDPPRFGIAGELYSQAFYDALARVIRRGGRLFHYTGTPNKLTSGRDVPKEVAARLRLAGFETMPKGDGVFATRR